ncbi:MAG: NAD(P)/FAD-dependent oxidoreductase [Ferruginibacter sp.]
MAGTFYRKPVPSITVTFFDFRTFAPDNFFEKNIKVFLFLIRLIKQTHNKMLVKDKKIAILGGGPGGLTLARLLQMKGAEVTVYERDLNRDVRVQGATLDLHQESGLAALAEAGLMEAFIKNYRPGADKICITDNNATIFYDEHTEGSVKDFGNEHFRPEIDRGPLRNILLDSLQPNTVVWDSQFVNMSSVANGWQLEFKNGSSATADIVIGADGANSKIRPFITSIKPFYTGVTAVEGSVYDAASATPGIWQLMKGGKIFAFGDEKNVIVSSKGDGSLVFYTSCKKDENWVKDCGIDFSDKVQLLHWFKKDFPEWGTIWHTLFENSQTYFIPRPIYCMPLAQTWKALPNLTMLGDAAHLMPPFAGEGVNMAMLDALELSTQLTNNEHKNLQTAIAAYEDQMRITASHAAKGSLENTEWMHGKNAIEIMLQMFSGEDKTNYYRISHTVIRAKNHQQQQPIFKSYHQQPVGYLCTEMFIN